MSGKGRLLRRAQLVISIALLAIAVWIARPAALWGELKTANPAYLALSLLLVPVLILLRIVRWHMLGSTRDAGMSFARSFHSYMGGLTLAIITPFSAGEIARGALAAPGDKAAFVGLTVLDKLLDVTWVLLLACAGFAVVAPGNLKILAAVAAGAVLAAWAAARPLVGFAERLLPESRISKALRRALEAARGVSHRRLAFCFLVAAANFALLYSHLYMIMYAFAPEIEPRAVGLFPLITLSRVIPTPAGLGAREFAAGALFARAAYQVSSAGAVVATFVQFVTLNVAPAAVWLVLSGGWARFLKGMRGDK